MKLTTVWIGIVLLAVGACGILDAAGVVDSAQTIGAWWPLAIVGWALAAMAGERRVTLGGVVCASVGLALLADVRAWASDVVVWSALALAVGVAVIVCAALTRDGRGDGDVPGSIPGGAS